MTEADEHDEPGGGGHRAAFVLAGLLVVALIAGLATVGLKGPQAPDVSAGSGCDVHALAYTVTDSPEEFAEQKRFEATNAPVTAPGLYEKALPLVPALHAASHSYVVVFYGDGVGGDAMDRLKGLAKRAIDTKAPVVIAPREQDPALVAIARGYELACENDTVEAAAEVSRFAAQTYASVADPDDDAADPPLAPSTPNDAPSPVDVGTP